MSNHCAGEDPAPADPRPFGETQREALSAIVAAGQDGTRFAAVTGEAGTGKTAVLDAAAKRLGQPSVQVIRIDAGDQPLTLMRLITRIAGARTDDDPASAIEQVMDRLLRPAPPCSRTILMVDDAHMLEQSALEYLQLTYTLQARDAACLQIVFAGRPQFWSLLDAASLGGLRERIGIRAVLERPREASVEADRARPGLAPARLRANHPSGDLIPLRPSRNRAKRYALGFGLGIGIVAAVLLVTMNPAARDTALDQVLAIRTWLTAHLPGTPVGGIRVASVGPSSTLPLASDPSAEAGAGSASDPAPPAVSPPAVQPDNRTAGTFATGPTSPSASVDGASTPTASAASETHTQARAATAGAIQPGSPPDQAVTSPAPDRSVAASAAGQAASPPPPPATEAAPLAATASPPAPPGTEASSSPLAHTANAGAGGPSPPPASAFVPELPDPPAFAQPIVPLPAAVVASLIRHGDKMLRLGDINAARLLYGRAAEAGSAAAAVAMGKTHDPRFLAQIGARGIAPDPEAAADWYRRAAALGDHDAARALAGHGAAVAQ